MGWFSEAVQGAIQRCLGRVSPYGTLTLTEDAIADLLRWFSECDRPPPNGRRMIRLVDRMGIELQK